MDYDLQAITNDYLIPWGINIAIAIAIFVVGKFVVGMLISLVRRLLAKANMDTMLIDFIASILNAILILFVIIAALDRLGVNTTSFIAVIGAAGLAIGLSLQSSLQNFASGLLLIVFRPFTVGNVIDAGGVIGKVEKISLFSTIMTTADNREVIVPNGQIYGGTITNNSARETRRIDMVFGIAYEADLRQAKQILQDILAADARILKDPAPLVAVAALADSSVNFNVRPWVKTGDYWDVMFAVTEQVKLRFDEHHIGIPFPQMDIHISKTEA